MAPILQQGLPKAGVVWTFPQALAHGPLEYSGLEIPHLFTKQTIAHMHTFLQYGPVKEDPMGFLLHTMGEAMHLEMGYGSKLLVAPLQLAANVTHLWLKHIWVTTQELKVNLQSDFADITLERQGDIELMRLFVQNGWKQPELFTLNQCHMYLKTFMLSDIIIGSGVSIAAQFWDQLQPAESAMAWPRTNQPSSLAWNTWQQALTSALHLGRNKCLAIPLGKWQEQSQPQGWYYHTATNSLWETNSLV